MNAATAAGIGFIIVVLLLIIRWKWRALQAFKEDEELEDSCPPCSPVQVVHRLCPHHNVVQSYEIEEKDSLDEHLDVLTRKLAEKIPPKTEDGAISCASVRLRNLSHLDLTPFSQEGRLRLSKSKIRETQNEIENLHAIDQDVKVRYREIMESLRTDLLTNEKECKKLQEQIEWVSRRRAELKDEVRQGQRLYGEAAAELASNLAELQRGRVAAEQRIFDKPQNQHSQTSLRLRKEPQLPRASPVGSLVIKNSPPLTITPTPGGQSSQMY